MAKGTLVTCDRCKQVLTKKELIDQVRVIRGNIITKEMVPDQSHQKTWEKTIDLCPACAGSFKIWYLRIAPKVIKDIDAEEEREERIRQLCGLARKARVRAFSTYTVLDEMAKLIGDTGEKK